MPENVELILRRYLLEEAGGDTLVLNKTLEVMVVSEGCLLRESTKSFKRDCGSFRHNWYLFTCILLVRPELSLKGNEDYIGDKEENILAEIFTLQKKKHTFKTRPGGDYDAQASNDCFLPGLNDDLALDCLARGCRSDYPSLACLNKRFHFLVNSWYLYKLRRRLGIIEHWVYLACSLMPWEAFDPSRRRWMRLPRMPCDECFSYADKESLAVGTQLLVFGRELSGFAIWMYSLVNRDWSKCPLMNLPRCLFGSSTLGEVAIGAGGSDKNGNVLKSAELYNSELGTWENLPDMNFPRKMCSGFFMDEKFYVIGGMSSPVDSLNCGEEYDLDTRTWRRIRNMYPSGNRATQSPPLVAVVNNELYAAD